jgi:Oxidoreductase family, NAD-binding Rossmann fold
MNIRALDSGPQSAEFRQRSVSPNKSARPLRVAIIGAGLMGYWHGRTARHTGSQVVAIVDTDVNRAKKLARSCRAAMVATEVSELHDIGLDAVHICSPALTHGSLTAQALDLGIHALVEKPLAESADETRRLLSVRSIRSPSRPASRALRKRLQRWKAHVQSISGFVRQAEPDAANRSWTRSLAIYCRIHFRYCVDYGRTQAGNHTAGS